MGNRWSGWFGTSATPVDPEHSSPHPKVRYEVVLPSGGRAWERLYNGDIDTWDAVAARYGMDHFAYDCGMYNCDREAVCLRYFSASLQSDKQTITIERFKRSTLQVPILCSPGLRALLSEGFQLNQVIAAQRGQLLLLVVRKSIDYMSQVAFPLISLADHSHRENANLCGDRNNKGSKKKRAEKGNFLQRHSSKRQQQDKESGNEGETKASSSSVGGERGEDGSLEWLDDLPDEEKNDDSPGPAKMQVRGRCLGVLHAPHRDMTIISCQLSPDLTQTAVLFYSLSPTTGCSFCYTLHFYSNLSLQEETGADAKTRAQCSASILLGRSAHGAASAESTTPHLLRTLKLSREVQPYFVFDPRFKSSRIAVANYECRETGINHELVLLGLEGDGGNSGREAEVVRRGKQSLPSLFGNSRFNLLYSKDGELIFLQKLTDDRFGVTSFCDIYVFSSNQLKLIKYLTASLPGLFHICKVCYEPVFSRCGSYMRILHFFMPSSHPSHAASSSNGSGGVGDNRQEGVGEEECTLVHVYQLPRALSLMSQCRRVILQQVWSERCVDVLPVPHKLQDYLKFRPIY